MKKEKDNILGITILTTIFASVKIGLILLIGPRLGRVLSDFNAEPTISTKFILQLSSLVRSYWLILFPIGFILIIVFSRIFGNYISKQNERNRILSFIIYIAIMIASVAFTLYALFAPIYALNQSL